jgi:hypothetical protein
LDEAASPRADLWNLLRTPARDKSGDVIGAAWRAREQYGSVRSAGQARRFMSSPSNRPTFTPLTFKHTLRNRSAAADRNGGVAALRGGRGRSGVTLARGGSCRTCGRTGRRRDPIFGPWTEQRFTLIATTSALSFTDTSRSWSQVGCDGLFWPKGYVIRAKFPEGSRTRYSNQVCYA